MMCVDPTQAGLDHRGHAMRPRGVRRPYRRAQPILAVVRQGDASSLILLVKPSPVSYFYVYDAPAR